MLISYWFARGGFRAGFTTRNGRVSFSTTAVDNVWSGPVLQVTGVHEYVR
jgi:hypothetical protein